MTWLWWLQILADALLIAAVGALMIRLKRGGGSAPAPAQTERFLKEAKQLSEEFDRLLAEKRELVSSTLQSLDERIASLNELSNRIDESSSSRREGSQGETQARGFRQMVGHLARQGKSPSQIAQATGRPRGEVELVLGLDDQGK